MSKILQVINKNTDFETGKIKLEFYETSFTMLSKIIGDVPGQTIDNVSAGDNVGYQIFRDLNVKQIEVKEKIEGFINKYNSWINTNKTKVTTLSNFYYIFSELTSDYADSIIANDKMDMLLMSKITGPEKELYDSTIKADESMENNLSALKSWSKTKNYGSCVYSCRSLEFDKGCYEGNWGISSSNLNGINVKIYSKDKYKDKRRIEFYNVQNLPIGYTATATLRGAVKDGYGWEYVDFTWSITRVPLFAGDTEGYIRFNASSGGGRNSPYVSSYNDVSSPHFDTNKLNLPFLESRILI